MIEYLNSAIEFGKRRMMACEKKELEIGKLVD